MSPLARVLAVLVCLVSVVQATFVVQMVAALDNKDIHISELSEKNKQLEGRLSVALVENVVVNSESSMAVAERDRSITQLTTELAATNRDNREKSDDIALLKSEKATLLGNEANLTAENLALTERNTDLHEENVALIRANSEADARETDLLTEVNDLTYAYFRTADEVARLQEVYAAHVATIAGHETRIGELVGLLKDVGIDSERLERAEIEIKGSVSDTVVTPGDVRLLSINVGSNDGVKTGMVFTVHGRRNGQDVYLGRAEIQSVDETVSIARVTEAANDEVASGDDVYILGFLR